MMIPVVNLCAFFQWCTFKRGEKECDYEWKRKPYNVTELNCADFAGRADFQVKSGRDDFQVKNGRADIQLKSGRADLRVKSGRADFKVKIYMQNQY